MGFKFQIWDNNFLNEIPGLADKAAPLLMIYFMSYVTDILNCRAGFSHRDHSCTGGWPAKTPLLLITIYGYFTTITYLTDKYK